MFSRPAMKKVLVTIFSFVIAVIVLAFAGCAGGDDETEKKPEENKGTVHVGDVYTTVKKKIVNEECDREITGIEVYPSDLEEGEKVPMIIYVHGAGGNENSLLYIAQALAAKGVAGYVFGCYGSMPGTPGYQAHYTSRMSDFETAFSYVNTLDYVDKENLYLLGESYGGLVVSLSAPAHNSAVKGLILVSTGISDGMLGATDQTGYMEKYVPAEPYEYIKGFTGDVIAFCGNEDTSILPNSENQIAIYNERENGAIAKHYTMNGEHSMSSFTEEDKTACFDIIGDFVNKTGEFADLEQ